MPPLPTSADLINALATNAQMKVTHPALRDYLAGVLGADGTIPTALATLGALGGQYLLRTTAYAVTGADRGRVIDTTGTWTLTLLAAASAGAGFSFVLRNLGAGTITIDPNGSETVDAATTLAVGPGASGLVICTGTAWLTLALPGSIMGAARGGNGSAAAPAWSFTSDPDTGMFSVGANILGFTTAGTEQARFTTTGMQVTGLLTGTAVTQSAIDTTANRLMKVGDFGPGGAATDYSGDIDDSALATGFYFALAGSTGVKPGAFTTGFLTITRRGLRVMQVWTTDTGREFRRFFFSTV